MKNILISVALVGSAFLALTDASILSRSLQGHNGIFQEDLTSCAGRCNVSGTVPNGCQCNTQCVRYNDCCPDYYSLCLPSQEPGSCAGRCGSPVDNTKPCQCNSACESYGDCCPDYSRECGGSQQPISNADLESWGEAIFALEGPNNAAGFVTWDLQGKTSSGSTDDLAPAPLLTVNNNAYQRPTIALLVALHDNYNPEVSVPEDVTPNESAEEEAFIDAVYNTPIIQKVEEVLTSKGVAFNRQKFQEMWFGLYSRSGSTLGSSGMEHVFLAELKSGVSGFHNWVFFAKEEAAGRLNYRGWMEMVDLGAKGAIIQHNFQWRGSSKPISSMFIGTSPEFEMGVYTLCWIARPDSSSCPMSFGGKKVPVTTWTIGSSKQFVASAYAL